jgi:hypothetical protein
MNKIFASASTSMCPGGQSPSSMRVCSIVMWEPRSTRARNNPIENGWVTYPSTLIYPKSCLSTQSLPVTFENILSYGPFA